MNLKKLLLTVFVMLVFTVIFLLCFQRCARAEEIQDAISSDTQGATEESGTEIYEKEDSEALPNENNPSLEDSQAQEKESEAAKKAKEIGIYIKEKILPVVVGVLTSVSALLATLMAIKRALSSIGETKDTFKKEAKERDKRFEAESEYLKKKTEEIEKALELVPILQSEIARLEKNTSALVKECTYLGKMISLGFSQSKDVVSSGNGKKINRLLTECQKLSGEGDEEEKTE